MEIYLKEFKHKFTVKASNKNMRLTYELELKMAKAGELEDKEPLEQLQDSLKLTNSIEQYLKDVLKLSDKQIEILDDLETEKTIELSNHVAMRLMGMSEKDIENSKATDVKEEKKAAEKE